MSDTKTRWDARLTDKQRAALDAAVASEWTGASVAKCLRAAFAAKPEEWRYDGWVAPGWTTEGPAFCVQKASPGSGWIRCRIHGVEILGDEEPQP